MLENGKNVILKDDMIIGYEDDIVKYLKSEIDRLLKNVVEEDTDFIKDMIDLIAEIKNNRCGLLKIAPCSMGGYSIEEIELY